MIIILLLGFRLGTIVLLPALLQVRQADVAHTFVCTLRVTEIMDGSLYWKEQRSSTGTQFAISHLNSSPTIRRMEFLIVELFRWLV